jgi:hypothetical protein
VSQPAAESDVDVAGTPASADWPSSHDPDVGDTASLPVDGADGADNTGDRPDPDQLDLDAIARDLDDVEVALAELDRIEEQSRAVASGRNDV